MKKKATTSQGEGSEEKEPLLQWGAEETMIDSHRLMERGFGPEEVKKAPQETKQSLENPLLEGRNMSYQIIVLIGIQYPLSNSCKITLLNFDFGCPDP